MKACRIGSSVLVSEIGRPVLETRMNFRGVKKGGECFWSHGPLLASKVEVSSMVLCGYLKRIRK